VTQECKFWVYIQRTKSRSHRSIYSSIIIPGLLIRPKGRSNQVSRANDWINRTCVTILQYFQPKKGNHTRCWWLTPLILTTQEAEIRRLEVQIQPWQIVLKTLSWKYPSQKWAGGVAQAAGSEFKPQYHQKTGNHATNYNTDAEDSMFLSGRLST
jgi:hypothetical protein